VKRIDALSVLAAAKGDAVSVTTMRAIPDWYEVGGTRSFHLDNRTCMGVSAAIGLGLAMARPGRRVMVIDGDGSLLMQLGTLASVAGAAPPNLYHFVLVNGVYETTGCQALPAAGLVDFVGLARASGYPHAEEIASIDVLRGRIAGILDTPGPVFVVLRVEPDETHNPGPADRPPDQAGRLRAQLAGAAA
jgi:phosphonopyruvate decarboxylase